jgi:F-type H+-transporting ATPase subunit delta
VKAVEAVAKPYARALHDLARERNQAERVAGELAALVALVDGDPGLRDFLARPWVAAPAKRAVALEIAERLGVSALTRDFVGLVARQRRAGHLAAIAATYQRLVDGEAGRVRARVRTAVALTEPERQALRERLARALQARGAEPGARPPEVVLEEVVDPQLLGGFVADIDSSILDGSLDGQLARLRERLARG